VINQRAPTKNGHPIQKKGTDLFKHRLAKQMRNLNKSVPLSGSNVTPKKAVTLIEKWLKGEGLMK
jgi:hypothetical protein